MSTHMNLFTESYDTLTKARSRHENFLTEAFEVLFPNLTGDKLAFYNDVEPLLEKHYPLEFALATNHLSALQALTMHAAKNRAGQLSIPRDGYNLFTFQFQAKHKFKGVSKDIHAAWQKLSQKERDGYSKRVKELKAKDELELELLCKKYLSDKAENKLGPLYKYLSDKADNKLEPLFKQDTDLTDKGMELYNLMNRELSRYPYSPEYY